MIWSFLEEHFSNRLEAKQSWQRLLNLIQGKKRLEEFNSDFIRLAFEAGES